MKTVFMGTPDFAVPCLEKLTEMGEEVVGVFTQPDKPVGRKQMLTASPVKVFAEEHSLTVYQPNSLKNEETVNLLKKLSPELIVVTAYGKILPKEVLDLPKYGCINIHASLLPKYRGAAPIQWSILNGDVYTGITSMQMDTGLDTGDILIQKEVSIGKNETSGELFDRLKILGAEVLEITIERLKAGELKPAKQLEDEATYVTTLDKSICPVDFKKTASEIHNKVRGLNPWPVATFKLNGITFKLWETRPSGKTDLLPGTVIESDTKLVIACGNNTSIELLSIQPEGKKRMNVSDYLRGNKIVVNSLAE